MGVTVNLFDRGQSAPASTLLSTNAYVGVSSAGAAPGTTAAVYTFSADGLVSPAVGYGPAPESVAAGVRVSGQPQVFVRATASIAGTNSAITQTGSGPALTLGGTPNDTYTALYKVTTGGPNGTAQGLLAMDGGTFGPTIDVPTPVAAAVVGTVDLSAYVWTGLGTKTLIVTPTNGSLETVTFAPPATSAAALTAINAVIGPATITGTVDLTGFTWTTLGTETLNFVTGDGVAIPVTFATPADQTAGLATLNAALGAHGTASVVAAGGMHYLRIADAITGTASYLTVNTGTANAALGLPVGPVTLYGAQASLVSGKYLKIQDGVAGSTSTLVVGAGTSNATLGLTAGTVTGAAATYVIPDTGLTLTFPVGTYVVNTTYAWTSTEPRFSTADLVAALAALVASGVPFRDIVVVYTPIDGADTRVWANQLATSLAGMRAATPHVYALGLMASSMGVQGATGIAANDLDVKAAMVGQSDPYVAVVHGDCYMDGTAISGSFWRPALFSIAIRAAAYPISSDPGNREQPQLEETSMVSADLLTYARDEQAAVTKMQSQGFTTLTSELGAPYCVQGLTRATSPTFRLLAVMRTAIQAARVLYQAAKRYQNANRFANPDGTLRSDDLDAIQTAVGQQIQDNLSNDISGYLVTIDPTQKVSITQVLDIAVDIQILAYFFQVNVVAGVVSVITTANASATQ